MKTKWRILLLLPFFALFILTSCQEEEVIITDPSESEAEAIAAESELATFVSATAKLDGSVDNIIDQASCISIKLPLTVVVNGLEIIIDSEDDFAVIEAIFDEFEDDEDDLDMIFPVTIINAEHDEITINNEDELEDYVEECGGENEDDDDIECIDFQYPISFSIFNADFLIIDTISIENDRELHRFMKRVRNKEVIASINYPVTMELADGTEIVVNNNEELHNTIRDAKDACDEDDDNDHNDDDFTKERLDEYLKKCPWLVHEFKRYNQLNTEAYFEYAINFKEDGVVVMRARNGDVLTGTWETRIVPDRGAKLKMEFDNLADFTLEWFIYEIEEGKVKIYNGDGGRIIMKRNCDVVIDHTKERVENFLQECLWRIARLSVNGADNEKDYIGTPLKFFEDNVVKIRVNGELVEGTYEVLVRPAGIGLEINLEGRPDLKLQWLITFLGENLIKLENENNKMVLMRHCPDVDQDINYIFDVLVSNVWEVASYMDHDADLTENYMGYALDFEENGKIRIFDPNENETRGSWLAYRNEGLFLGMKFGEDNEPFNELTHRWKIKEITSDRIELKIYNPNGVIEKILVLEHADW
ncbi:hypothetical protein [Seonamhaeicola marinus]|uniref:Lipocalin-like domain-containing protein n=1 Tax=Seonamhaeicola marinus TaxID=1912246 RepID=A0A5D0IMK3_9FLAO|nr:hypothetical protein [Seonamhaeicola marinus]TYA84418.1 hypothetical protein FUA24_07170 [Seonamhaeicola marinus]